MIQPTHPMKCERCKGDGCVKVPNGNGTEIQVECKRCMGTGVSADALRIVRNHYGVLCAIAEGGE